MSQTKMITKRPDSNGFEYKRERAQIVSFEKMRELLQRNVSKTSSKSFTQYTKELLRNYINSPVNNQDQLREISRFLCRYSMLYKKILMYYASMPLFYYNVTQINDLTKTISADKSLKGYQKILSEFETFKLKKEGYTALYMAIRDGFSVFEMYDEGNGKFFMPLDVQYCRIYGKTDTGEWIVYYNAAYFDTGNNSDFIYGINNDGVGVWSDVHINGYREYKEKGRDHQWYRLDPSKTFCLTTCSDDEFDAPLPFFLPLFDLILDDLDLQDLINNRTALENYVLLLSKIPLKDNSQDIDDFAVSLELVQTMQSLIDAVVPDLIGTAYSPMDIEKIEFPRSNTTETNDELSKSVQNIFNNAGACQLVVSGGSSSNSIGLKHSIENDISTCWIWVEKIESWLNYYIKENISDGYRLRIHKITWYNQDEYRSSMKDAATLGGSALDYLTSTGDSPYMALQKLNFENTLGIKDLMIPLQSSYTMSSDSKTGAPVKSEDELSESGAATRNGDKNAGTKANS